MKRLISIWITVLLLLSVCCVSPVAAANDPYTGIDVLAFDGRKTDNRFRTDEGCLGAMYTSHHVYWKKIDFGDVGPSTVNVSIGAHRDYIGQVDLCIDSPDSAPIASIVPQISNWLVPMDNIVEITRKVTGVHDLYLVVKAGTQNIFGIKFNKPAGDGIYSEYREETLFSDIDGNRYQKEIEMMSELGFMQTADELEFRPSLVVTKGSFVKMLYKIWNETPMPYEPVFTDIAEDSEFAAAATFLYKAGMLTGKGEKFRPHSYIKPYEAATMLCRTLGYGKLMDLNSRATANLISSNSLLKGFTDETYLKRDACAALIYRGLKMEYADITGVGEDIYYTESDEGILSATQSILIGKGTVSKTGLTGLYSPETDVPLGSVAVGDAVYKTGATRAASYLGYECEFFYSVDKKTDVKTILTIRPTGKAETLWIDSENLEQLTAKKIDYLNDRNRSESIVFPSNAKIIYNGKALDDDLSEILTAEVLAKPLQGKIRCVDNGDGFDTFFIDMYQNMIVAGVDSDNILHDAISGKTIDLKAKELVLHRDGNEVIPEDIMANDTAVVYVSANTKGKQLVRAYISSKTAEGTIYEIEEDGKVKLTVDETKYTVATESTDFYTVGTYAEFYLTAYNEILGFTNRQSAEIMLGYLLGLDKQTAGLAETGFKVKMVDAEGKLKELSTAKNIIVDGVRCKTGSDYLSAISAVQVQMPVRYALNTDGELRFLDTVLVGKGGGADTLKELTNGIESMVYYKASRFFIRSGEDARPNNGGKAGVGIYGLTENAKVFALWLGGQPEDMSIELPQNMSSDGYKYGRIYSSTGDDTFGDLFVWKDCRNEWKYPAVAEKKTTATAEDGSLIYRIYGYSGANEVVYNIPENRMSGDIKKVYDALSLGDCFHVRTDFTGNVSHLQMVYLRDGASSKGALSPTDFGGNSDEGILIHTDYPLWDGGSSLQYDRYIISEVIEKRDGFVKVQYTQPYKDTTTNTTELNTITELLNVNGVGVCSYETDGSKPRLMKGLDYANINVGDKIFTYAEDSMTKLVVIYKHSHPTV